MQLISGLVSNNAAKVRMVLAEKGIAYETTEVPWTKTNAWEPKPQVLLDNNPRAQVPVLIDDGLTLWDSTVINEYLEEVHPSPSLLPGDARQRALVRLWEDEGDDNQTHVGVLIQDVFLAEPGAELSERAQAAIGSLQALVKRMDRQLEGRDYICGEFSLADISLFLTLAFARTMGLEVQGERVNAWYERVLARPAIAAEFQLMMAGVSAL